MDYVTQKTNKIILESLSLILEDLESRLTDEIPVFDQIGEKVPPEVIVRRARARYLMEDIQDIVRVKNTPEGSCSCGGDCKPEEPVHKSRFRKLIDEGRIKTRPETFETGEEISMGIGTIEMSENDEVTDTIEK